MSIGIVANVVARYVAAAKEADLRKFQGLIVKVRKEASTLAGLYKTYDRQAHGYRTQNLEKAQVTRAKIGDKLEKVLGFYQQAFKLAEPVLGEHDPVSDYKKRMFVEFKNWMGKYEDALNRYSQALSRSLSGPGTSPPLTFTWGLDGGHVPPGQNPVMDLYHASGAVDMYWGDLLKPEKDPLNVPKDGTDEERFMAFLTPDVKRLAKATATKIKKDKAMAATLAWSVLEDVNAHSAANTAESILSPLVPEPQDVTKFTSNVSGSGAIAVALMQEVGEGSYASRLAKGLAKDFAEYTVGE